MPDVINNITIKGQTVGLSQMRADLAGVTAVMVGGPVPQSEPRIGRNRRRGGLIAGLARQPSSKHQSHNQIVVTVKFSMSLILAIA